MDKGVVKRMKEVEETVLRLDPNVRGPAFQMMENYILFGEPEGRRVDRASESARDAEPLGVGSADDIDFVAFMDQHESQNPPDNARALAGYLYSQYGIRPFTANELRELAAKAGVTIPDRVDMTLHRATHEGKPLFKPAGARRFRPTVQAESYFRIKYGLRKGNRTKPGAS